MSDAIATALRIAERKTDRNPSDAQKESGNYSKGKMPWHGLSIAIETVKGATRSGMGKDGKRWSVKQPASYGYVLGSEAKDGDHVDVYLGPDHASQKVFVIDQIDADTGKYDEAKAMLSYPSKEAALSDYRKAFSDGKANDRIGGITEMSIDKFKTWVKSSETKKPLSQGRKYADGGKVTDLGWRSMDDSIAKEMALQILKHRQDRERMRGPVNTQEVWANRVHIRPPEDNSIYGYASASRATSNTPYSSKPMNKYPYTERDMLPPSNPGLRYPYSDSEMPLVPLSKFSDGQDIGSEGQIMKSWLMDRTPENAARIDAYRREIYKNHPQGPPPPPWQRVPRRVPKISHNDQRDDHAEEMQSRDGFADGGGADWRSNLDLDAPYDHMIRGGRPELRQKPETHRITDNVQPMAFDALSYLGADDYTARHYSDKLGTGVAVSPIGYALDTASSIGGPLHDGDSKKAFTNAASRALLAGVGRLGFKAIQNTYGWTAAERDAGLAKLHELLSPGGPAIKGSRFLDKDFERIRNSPSAERDVALSRWLDTSSAMAHKPGIDRADRLGHYDSAGTGIYAMPKYVPDNTNDRRNFRRAFEVIGGDKKFAAGGVAGDWDGPAELADISGPSTGDLVNSVPRRLAERSIRRLNTKRIGGLDLTPQELSDLAAHGRWTDEVGEPGARNAIAELSGVNNVRRGVDDIGRASDDGDWLRGLSGGAQIATGLLPYAAMTRGLGPAIGSLYSSPVKAGAVGGALALPTAVSDRAQAQQAKAEAQIIGELQQMPPARLREHQSMLGIAPDGRLGQETIRATIAHVRAKEAADSPERELRRLGAEGDNAAKIEAAKIKAQAEADALRMREELKMKDERKASDAKLPLRELFSDYMWGLPIASGVAGGLLGGKIKGKYTAAHETELRDLSGRTKAALDVGDRPLANALQKRVDDLLAAGPGGTLKAVRSSALLGGNTAILPEEFDLARSVPGAWERATDIPTMAKRFGMGAVLGAGPAETAALFLGAKSKKDVAGIPNYKAEVGVDPTKSVAARMKHIEDQMKLDRASIRADAKTSEAKSVADASRRDAELTRLEAAEARRRLGEPKADQGQLAAGQSQTQRQLPSPGSSESSLGAPAPVIPGTQMPLPPGWKLDKNGTPYNAHRGWKIPKDHYTAKPDKKQSKDAKKSNEDDTGKAHGGGVSHALGLARKYASGGRVLTGAVIGKTDGRGDALPVDVPEGAFVVPADIVAALGSGNTLAGMHKLEKTFGKSKRIARSSGGAVPIRISDGEYVVSPEHVAQLGHGDMDAGHRTLDALVMRLRNQNIKALASLPPPSK